MLQSQLRSTTRLMKYSSHLKAHRKNNFRWEIRRAQRSCICTTGSGSNYKRQPKLGVLNGSTLSNASIFHNVFFSSNSKTDSGHEDEVHSEAAVAGEEFETDFDFVSASDDHLKIQLYPNDPDLFLSKIYNASTLQEIFDSLDSIPSQSKNVKHTSQALVSIVDLQKLFYKLCIGFDPEKENENRALFVKNVLEHQTLKEIVQHLISNCKSLGDEPLGATLLSLIKLNYKLESEECQAILQECLNRKTTLELPAISRITVCLRNDSNGFLINEFAPCLLKHVENMDNDLSVRLVSISLRNSHYHLSGRFLEVYREQIAKILSEGTIKFEPITLCKMMLCLTDTNRIVENPDFQKTSCFNIIRQIGILLADRVHELDILELLSLQRFLEFGPQEPRNLIDLLVKKISRLIEEQEDTPLLNLVHCILPTVKSASTRRQLSLYVREYLDRYQNFGQVASNIAKILRSFKLDDKQLFDQFWLKAEKFVKSSSNDPRRVLKFAQDYLSFVRINNCNYRNATFEITVKQLLYLYIRNYTQKSQPSVLFPGNIAKIFTFMIAFGSPQEPIFYDQSNNSLMALLQNQFANSFKVLDLILIARGIETSMNIQINHKRQYPSKYFDQILNLISTIDRCLGVKLLGNPPGSSAPSTLTPQELNMICKTQRSVNKGSSDSPIFNESMKKLSDSFENQQLLNSRLCKDVVVTLLSTNYNMPSIFNSIKNYISTYSEFVSPDLVAKFVFLAYSVGYESEHQEDLKFFQTCYGIINKYWMNFGSLELLQAMQALCFYRALESDLVKNVFSIKFLDHVDEELATGRANPIHPMKVRSSFMELNRAVCLDLPQSEVPWFHEKFCQDIRTTSTVKMTHLHNEVYSTLCEVLNSPDCIQQNSYSPYSYLIDFLIEFDKKGRPIKKAPQKRSLFSFKKAELSSDTEVQHRVAILILPERSFTKNVRWIRGYSKLRARHLEMLGYRVVQIDFKDWNSMYMSEPSVKADYLEQCIYPKQDSTNVLNTLTLT